MSKGFARFFYSTQNLAGMVLAILGLGAFLGGWIKAYWPFIVLGLYGIGYFVMPRRHEEIAELDRTLDSEALLDELGVFLRRVKRRLSPPVVDRLNRFQETATAVMGRIDRLPDLGDTAHLVRQTVSVYLPGLIHDYLELPPAFARLQPIRDGRTARELLLEQLDILNEHLTSILADIHGQQIDKLEAHGEFLRQRLGRSQGFFD